MDYKNEKGITLVALVITIVLLTILGALSLNVVNNTTDTTISAKEIAELNMIQQLILEKYTKYILTNDKDMLAGDKIEDVSILPWNLKTLSPLDIKATEKEDKEYFYLIYNDNNENNADRKQYLEDLGIDNTTNVYIVNYYTGEVMQLETEEKLKSDAITAGNIIIKNAPDGKCVVIKVSEENKYVIKQTSEGELLYTYALNEKS